MEEEEKGRSRMVGRNQMVNKLSSNTNGSWRISEESEESEKNFDKQYSMLLM